MYNYKNYTSNLPQWNLQNEMEKKGMSLILETDFNFKITPMVKIHNLWSN